MDRERWVEFAARLRKIRERFARGAPRRAFAREVLKMNEGSYLNWESKGHAPTEGTLIQVLRRLPEVRDPDGLAVWALTGVGDEAALLGASATQVPAQPVAAPTGSVEPAVLRSAVRSLAADAALADEAALGKILALLEQALPARRATRISAAGGLRMDAPGCDTSERLRWTVHAGRSASLAAG